MHQQLLLSTGASKMMMHITQAKKRTHHRIVSHVRLSVTTAYKIKMTLRRGNRESTIRRGQVKEKDGIIIDYSKSHEEFKL